jgi:hypothetical protein
VFPFRVKRNLFDPTRHQTSFKTAWKKMTATAGLSGLRMYDLRHHAITVLLEIQMYRKRDGRDDRRAYLTGTWKKRYSHVRMEAMRAALQHMQASRQTAPPLGNRDVADMLASSFSPEVVVAKIKAGPCAFDISIDAMKQLKVANVPDSVILAMVKAG